MAASTVSIRTRLGTREVILPSLLALTALFLAELVPLTIWLDTATLGHSGLTGVLERYGAWTLRGLVAAAAITVVTCLLKRRESLAGTATERLKLRPRFLALHAISMISAAILAGRLFHSHPGALEANVLTALTILAGLIGGVSACLALIPLPLWRAFLQPALSTWPLLVAVALSACLLGTSADNLWRPLSRITMEAVTLLIRPFVPSPFIDVAHLLIRTPHFEVQIASQCSGLEGMGLMVSFGAAWLWLFRSEFRFPRALLLVPVGAAAMWVANAARIAVLILIGEWGAPAVATGGFHSQAGWIAFTSLALGLAILSQRIPWMVHGSAESTVRSATGANSTAAYLMPFLAILAAGMVSRALSSEFEWLYALRFLAAAAAIWIFRDEYRKLDWQFGWLAALTGAVVIGLWIGFDRSTSAESALGRHLGALPPVTRFAWLAVRTLGAVITVPIAEELAFRGYLMRRLMAADFEAVDCRRFSWMALVVSSVAFGLMHGERWLVGTVAGLLFGWIFLRRGRIGDAVVAHATANALLALWVLATGNWQLW